MVQIAKRVVYEESNPHRHEDVAVFDVFVGVFGAHLAG
jgi:hypothetical protein